MGRARVDVTWRISGLFRDLFPAQIALLDAATKAVAARDEPDEENPLAAIHRSANDRNEKALARIFGTAPGAYGAGIEDLMGSEAPRDDIGAGYLAAASHIYSGADGQAMAAPGQFSDRVAAADLLIHSSDDPGRDLLEGAEDRLEARPQAFANNRVQALAVVVDDPPAVAKAMFPAFEKGLKNVALIHLGIADKGDHTAFRPPVLGLSPSLGPDIILNQGSKQRLCDAEADRAGRKIHIVAILGARGIALGTFPTPESLKLLQALASEDVKQRVQDG